MPDPPSKLEKASDRTRRWLVGLLLLSYLLAALVPAPGLWLHALQVPTADGGSNSWTDLGLPIRFSLVLVGVLLFSGAVSIDVSKLRDLLQRPRALLIALVGVWLPPIVLVTLCNSLTPHWLPAADAAALGLGLALAGAMPVANSAVAWTQQSGGSLAWALGLVVLSICLCPWVTPQLMGLMGATLTNTAAAAADTQVARFTGGVFMVWVLGPTLLGFAVRAAAGGGRVAGWRPVLTLASAAALLLLNYANAATALPSVVSEPQWPLLLTTLAASLSLPLVGVALGWMLAGLAGVSHTARAAWAFGLGMKNTGLALGLAGVALGEAPTAVLAILVVTLTQHLVAGAAHTRIIRLHPINRADD